MSDMDKVVNLIEKNFEETNKKIELLQASLQSDIAYIHTNVSQHNDRITTIEHELTSIKNSSQLDEIKIQVETLKQDRLRTNIRLTGLPTIAFDDPIETVFSIDNILQIGLIPSDFSVYADRNKSSLIISFSNYSLKRTFMSLLQQRKSLLAEEVFPAIESSSNIYANDQLPSYFAELFQSAWQAKKEGKVYSASSLGGKIKVKQCESSPAIIINTQQQLDEVINDTRQPEAPTPSNGSTNARDDDNNKENNPRTNSQQPASNNPALQRYIARKTTTQRDQRPVVNKFSSRIRADVHKQRLNSRDRAYRGDIDFEFSPPPKTSNRFSENRFNTHIATSSQYQNKNRHYEYNDPRPKYSRDR